MEADCIQTIAIAGFIPKIVRDRDTVRGILKTQHQVIAYPAGSHITSSDAFTQLQYIHSTRAGVIVVDGILAISLVKYIGVTANPAIKGVIAQATS